jgi:prolyl oligopeptidase
MTIERPLKMRAFFYSIHSLLLCWIMSVPGFPLASANSYLTAEESPTTSSKKVSEVTPEEDPFLWLEEVSGEKALDWVRQRNQLTQKRFDTEEFKNLEQDLLEILDSDDRIPFVSKHGEFYYNFWRDKEHERGIWRRTTLQEFRKDDPEWEILIDLDQLAESENENWVWSGASLLKPDYDLALVNLSRGGADATVTREFSLTTKSFVKDGFQRPESKGGLRWIDRDQVFVFTDFGEGSMTSSGYPRIVKWWRRGEPMDEAKVVYEGLPEDMYISGFHDDTPGYERNFVSRTVAFYNDELYLLSDEGQLQKIDVPNSVNKTVFRDQLLLELREPWEVGGQRYEAGSLLVANFDDFLSGQRKLQVLFTPTERTSLAGFSPTKDTILLNVLDDVKNRIFVLEPDGQSWSSRPLPGTPSIGTVTVSAVDPDESNEFWMISSGYLTPSSLYVGVVGEQPELLKQLPAQFDADGLEVQQFFATSKDGTSVPYFLVAAKELALDGTNPTLLYGYGGFEISLTPNYNPAIGRAWCGQGGVYVVANIRGGGEYGPRWHQAALKQNRLRAYEDFAAVAKDLVTRGITSPKHLGIQGGSNGGLLVGNMVALYPELFSAAVCQVPLLDMRRFHLLLAGASWMAEYGNPDAPGEWDFIQTYSPYQNIRSGRSYPSVLFTTSTRDDRVHPGHARKMMALMESQGHDVWYYENIEGGHGGAANNRQRATMQAFAYSFLKQELFP